MSLHHHENAVPAFLISLKRGGPGLCSSSDMSNDAGKHAGESGVSLHNYERADGKDSRNNPLCEKGAARPHYQLLNKHKAKLQGSTELMEPGKYDNEW